MTAVAPLPLRRVSLHDALDAMEQFPVRAARAETLPVAEAEGRILAVDVRALEDVPAFRRSRVDGYAVRADEVRAATPDHPVTLEVVSDVGMGTVPAARLGRGEAMRIPTGGALPGDATVNTIYA